MSQTETRKLTDAQIAALLERIQLRHGNHEAPVVPKDPTEIRACVMEVVAYVAGEEWSDHPKCACPVITRFCINLNDRATDEARQLLKPLIPKLVGTRSTPAVERKRAWLVNDWAVRGVAPRALEHAKLPELAKRLRDLPELTGENYQKARKVCIEVRDAARAASEERRAAPARAAARAAAYAYAAADADAAYAAAAAADAAYAAADAAYAAYAAYAAAAPAYAARAADAAAYAYAAYAADAARAGAARAAAYADASSLSWEAARAKAWSELMPVGIEVIERMVAVTE